MRSADGSRPTLTVVIPCFNQGRFLSAAIDSALGQLAGDLSFNVEVIVVNDGSSDDTRAVAAGYGNRIQYIEQPNAGVSAARNRGMLASSPRCRLTGSHSIGLRTASLVDDHR